MLKPKSASQLQSLAVTTGIMQQRGAELVDGGQVIKHEHEHRQWTTLDSLYKDNGLPGGPVMEAEVITGFGASEAPVKKSESAGDEIPAELDKTEDSDRAARGESSGSS